MKFRSAILSLTALAAILMAGCNQEAEKLVADFNASATAVDQGGTIDFTDASTGGPTSWQWVFNGGTPDSADVQNPTNITYNTAGMFSVTLTVSNEEGNDTQTKTGYIEVIPAGAGCDSLETVTDVDGNIYPVVEIGYQCWMAENLRTSHYRDGSPVPLVTDSLTWTDLATDAYCWYGNDNGNEDPYGKLYNWFAVEDLRGLCPEGWHIPTDQDWFQLSFFLGGSDIAGGMLKESGTTHWVAPNTGATNSTGFRGLPGGYRHNDGEFYFMGENGLYWSSTRESLSLAWFRNLTTTTEELHRTNLYKKDGFSCRCVKD